MATIRIQGNSAQIRWYRDKQRYSLSVAAKDADESKLHVEHLIDCAENKRPPVPPTLAWVDTLSDEQRQKLATANLIKLTTQVQPITLGKFVESYFLSLDAKKSTKTFYGHTRKRLLEYFAPDTPITSVTAMQAREFRSWLTLSNKRDKKVKKPLSEATLRRRIGLCKQIFQQAFEDGLIDRNPFRKLVSSNKANKERQQYIEIGQFNKVLASAQTPHWRSILVLARVAALRCPSELAGLLWSEVDFARKVVVVHSPKTEHHEGREKRVIPLFPAVEKELLALREDSDGSDRVFPTITLETNLRTHVLRILQRAQVKPWPKLMQNLRASGATDMARKLPAHVATAICGHTVEVAIKSYWQVTDDDLSWARVALEIAPSSVDKGQAESTYEQTKEVKSVINLLQDQGLGDLSQLLSTQAITPLVGEEGSEYSPDSHGKCNDSEKVVPFAVPFQGNSEPSEAERQLRELANLWPSLTQEKRSHILSIATNEF